MAALALHAARLAGKGAWTCLSAHVPPSAIGSLDRLLGRSSNAAGIVGHQLLVFSGENTPRVPIDDAVHSFDLQTHQWSKVQRKDGQTWPCARIGHAGAVIDSKLYVSGGRTGLQAGDDTLADLWRWSIPEASWQLVEPKGAAPPPLSYHVLATSGAFLYAFGGCTVDHGRTNGLWCLDTTNDEWTELATPNTNADSSAGPCGRGGPSVAASENEVWVGFGYNGKEEQADLWKFDLKSRSWNRVQALGDAPKARSVTDLVLLPDYFGSEQPALFVFGGEFTPSVQGHEGAGEYHSDAFLYDVKRNAWITCKPTSDVSEAPIARGWFNTLRFGGTETVVFGGFDGKERRNDVYKWTPASDEGAITK